MTDVALPSILSEFVLDKKNRELIGRGLVDAFVMVGLIDPHYSEFLVDLPDPE